MKICYCRYFREKIKHKCVSVDFSYLSRDWFLLRDQRVNSQRRRGEKTPRRTLVEVRADEGYYDAREWDARCAKKIPRTEIERATAQPIRRRSFESSFPPYPLFALHADSEIRVATGLLALNESLETRGRRDVPRYAAALFIFPRPLIVGRTFLFRLVQFGA